MPASIECPYCGEPIEVETDCSGGSQDYIEDCHVCCCPIEFRLETGINGELLSLEARRDND